MLASIYNCKLSEDAIFIIHGVEEHWHVVFVALKLVMSQSPFWKRALQINLMKRRIREEIACAHQVRLL